MNKEELINYISKIENINGKINNITVLAEIKTFTINELVDTISICMEITDGTGSIKALLVSNRSNKELKDFINSLNERKQFKTTIDYQINGNVVIIDNDIYDELISKKFMLKNIQIGDKLLIINAIKNIGIEYDTLFGKRILYLHECKLEELYQLIKDNTDYLNNIHFNEVKDIQITNDKDICILLKNGIFRYNGKVYLDNIHCLWFNCGNVYAISEDKKITIVNCKHDIASYLNNNNYQYKKIILNLLSLTALTHDGKLKMCGFVVDSGIDYKRFIDIDDIGYNIEKNEVVIIQDNEIKSLFISINDNTYTKSQIKLEGKSEDKDNYFEII